MTVLRAVSVVALSATLVGCAESTSPQDKSPQDVTIADLVGTWVAQSLVYTAAGSPTQQFDIVAAGGSVTQVIAAGGAFTGTTVLPDGGGTVTFTGTFTVSNGVLTQDFSGDPPTLKWTIASFANGSMTYELSEVIGGEVLWNFGGGAVPASIRSVVTRR